MERGETDKSKILESGSTSTSMRCLGRQRVVIAFAAFALAAEDYGSGQEEEGGGNEQEQAEAGEDAHDLRGHHKNNK